MTEHKTSENERFLYLFPDFIDRLDATGLTASGRMAWFEVLLAQLRYGHTYSAFHPPRDYPVRMVRKFEEHGLLERREDGYLHIVDWEVWNGRAEYKRLLNRERQQRFRDRRKSHRNGDS